LQSSGLTPVAIIGFNFVKYQCEKGTTAQQKQVKLKLPLGLKSPEDSGLAVEIDIPREIKVAL
jgi:hypothetical protein